jgi:neutral ceramidase
MAPIFQSRLAGPHQYPSFVQLAALRIGDMLVGVVPAEVTTMAGLRIMGAMQSERPMHVAEDHVAILGIANGHIQYVTTREEYWAQLYEGSSNVYGPGTAEMLQAQLRSLTQSLKADNPTVVVGPITVKPGPPWVGWPPMQSSRPCSDRSGC